MYESYTFARVFDPDIFRTNTILFSLSLHSSSGGSVAGFQGGRVRGGGVRGSRRDGRGSRRGGRGLEEVVVAGMVDFTEEDLDLTDLSDEELQEYGRALLAGDGFDDEDYDINDEEEERFLAEYEDADSTMADEDQQFLDDMKKKLNLIDRDNRIMDGQNNKAFAIDKITFDKMRLVVEGLLAQRNDDTAEPDADDVSEPEADENEE